MIRINKIVIHKYFHKILINLHVARLLGPPVYNNTLLSVKYFSKKCLIADLVYDQIS